MPELPEVETVRRGLEPVMAGQRIVRVEQRRPDLRFPFPERFAERLAGRRIQALARRAKYLLAEIEGDDVLLMHLGMSGRFATAMPSGPLPSGPKAARTLGTYVNETANDSRHDHVVFHLESGATVTYNDPRRFGFMLLLPDSERDRHPLLAGLGAEPLGNELDAGYLAARASGRRVDLKALLLDQRVIAGLGNIYVAEALFRARLSPHRAAGCLANMRGAPTERCERLIPAIREVLGAALDAGGSTLRDYRQADGGAGAFQHQFLVYDRAGEPCLRVGCGGIVRRTIQAGRSTFYCPACQR